MIMSHPHNLTVLYWGDGVTGGTRTPLHKGHNLVAYHNASGHSARAGIRTLDNFRVKEAPHHSVLTCVSLRAPRGNRTPNREIKSLQLYLIEL